MSLVEALQRDALDHSVPVSTLLRRMKLVAVKLGLGAVEDWVEQELSGYKGKVPEYRIISGSPMMLNPVRGWIPIGGAVEMLSRRPSGQPIAELESLVEGADGDASFMIPYPDKVSARLNEMNGIRGWTCALQVGRNQIAGILDRVRTAVLDWALELEKAGIMGGDISFDNEEKKKAQAAAVNIHIGSIGSFAGNLGVGNVSGNAEIRGADLGPILDQLKPALEQLAAAGANDSNLRARIGALEVEIAKPRPDQSAVRGLVTDLRNALAGAAGNLIASGAISALNLLLGTGVPGGVG